MSSKVSNHRDEEIQQQEMGNKEVNMEVDDEDEYKVITSIVTKKLIKNGLTQKNIYETLKVVKKTLEEWMKEAEKWTSLTSIIKDGNSR